MKTLDSTQNQHPAGHEPSKFKDCATKVDMSERGNIRDDFIRRLFAVAISVGFASTLIQMKWVSQAKWPNEAEWQQLYILATGLVATVLSWDGYLMSIKAKPLEGYARFAIDIVLVFIYMFLLISSQNSDFWLPIIVIIFALYSIWDLLTVIEHYKTYDLEEATIEGAGYKPSLRRIVRVYLHGFLGRAKMKRGPIVTLSWGLYFLGLWLLTQPPEKSRVLAMCTLAILGLYLYRRDKSVKTQGSEVEGYSMLVRATVILILLGAAALYFFIFRTR